LFYGVLNTRTGDLEFASNGHPAPYFHSSDGDAKPLHDAAKPHAGHIDRNGPE
jgi:serine phosphatase RsbU (regulator of sigma subunit)